jgi:hypothetical protein
MALGSTQPLVKMSTRDVPGGKGDRCLRPPYSADVKKSRLLDPSGPAWPVMGVLYLTFSYLLVMGIEVPDFTPAQCVWDLLWFQWDWNRLSS